MSGSYPGRGRPRHKISRNILCLRATAALSLGALLLAACGTASRPADVRGFLGGPEGKPRGRWTPITGDALPKSRQVPPLSCTQKLALTDSIFLPLPDVSTPVGCGYENAVIMVTVGDVRLRNYAILRCDTALRFAGWIRNDVQPTAQAVLGARVTAIKVSDHYNCRLKGGRAIPKTKSPHVLRRLRSRLSQHSFGYAVDVSRLWIEGGRMLHVMLDWHGPMRRGHARKGVLRLPATSERDLRRGAIIAFWREISRRACDRFTKVLTPEYNWLHRHHIHMDTSAGRACMLDGTVAGAKRYVPRSVRRAKRARQSRRRAGRPRRR